MKRPLAGFVLTATLLGVAILAVPPSTSQAQAPAPYGIRYLRGLGGTHSRGDSINDAGWVAGYSHLDANHRHAALWLDETPVDLGTLGSKNKPKNSSVVWPVKNTSGVIVGISQTDAPDPYGEDWSCSAFFPAATATGKRCLGFAWQDGVMRPLPTLGGTNGFATGANDAGEIVGWAETDFQDPTCNAPQVLNFRAVVWGPHGNSTRVLPIPAGDSSSAATAINDHGQVVGIAGDCDVAVGGLTGRHMLRWEADGSFIELPGIGGAQFNTPMTVNERGDVAGFLDHPGDVITEAFIWTPEGGTQLLGFLRPSDTLSEATGINDRRQVVGLSCTGAACRAFLWQDGVMHDLNDLIAADPSVLLTHAMDVNTAGEITGRATRVATGERVTFVAMPTGAPIAALATASDSRRGPSVTLPDEALREAVGPLGPATRLLGTRH